MRCGVKLLRILHGMGSSRPRTPGVVYAAGTLLLILLLAALTLIPLAVGRFIPRKHISFAADITRKHRTRDKYLEAYSRLTGSPLRV